MKKIKLSKKTIIAVSVVAALAVLFAILLPLYLKENKENRDLHEVDKIRVTAGGALIGEYTLEQITALVSPVEFQAVFKPSGRSPIERTYEGVFLKDFLEALDIDLSDYSSVEFKASDGHVNLYPVADVLEDGNVYIAYKVNGKPFIKGIDPLIDKDTGEDGGTFVVIKAFDSVSQNRVKLLTEIILK